MEVSIITEQKIAKLIELVERLRQDSPDLPDSVDEEAAAMTKSADPQAVLDAILQSHTS